MRFVCVFGLYLVVVIVMVLVYVLLWMFCLLWVIGGQVVMVLMVLLGGILVILVGFDEMFEFGG